MTTEQKIKAAAETLENAAATLRSLIAPYAAHYPAERLESVLRSVRQTEGTLVSLAAYWPEVKR